MVSKSTPKPVLLHQDMTVCLQENIALSTKHYSVCLQDNISINSENHPALVQSESTQSNTCDLDELFYESISLSEKLGRLVESVSLSEKLGRLVKIVSLSEKLGRLVDCYTRASVYQRNSAG